MTAIPFFMHPLQPVPVSTSLVYEAQFLPATEAGGGASHGDLPGLEMIAQEEINWCWSSVTQAVLDFRRGLSKSQEGIATDHAVASGKPYTCAPPDRTITDGGQCANVNCQASCNDPHILRIILAEQHCFATTVSTNAAPSFQQVKDEVDAGRPLPCRVQWNNGGGHFILVSGWTIGDDGIERVHVFDPASNEGGEAVVERAMPYSTFATAYGQTGLTGYINYSYRVR